MAEPLLLLATNPEITQGALRMGGNITEKQLDGGDLHPFAQLLAGHAGGPAQEVPLLVAGRLAGNPQGQPLTVDGKPLPDALRLLAQAGLPLDTGEMPPVVVAEAGAVLESGLDPASGLTGSLPLSPEVAAVRPEAPVPPPTQDLDSEMPLPPAVASAIPSNTAPVDAEDPVPSLGQASGGMASAAVVARDEGMEATRHAGGPEARTPATPLTPLAQGLANATGQRAQGEGPSTSLPKPGAETVPTPGEPVEEFAAAVQQALRARTGEAPGRAAHFNELVRSAASQAATETAPARAEGLAPGPQPAAAPQAQATALPVAAVAVPLRQAGWDQALGEQVQWLVGSKAQGAEIRLNPAHLGPMEVRIQIQQDQANISFTAQHSPVREALEAAIPRLREMLGDSGLQLNNVTVSDQSLAEQRSQGRQQGHLAETAPGMTDRVEDEAPTVVVTPLREDGGTIDYFA